MKMNLRILALLLITLFVLSAFGQSGFFTVLGPAANCELVMAQLDAFVIELQNDPSAAGKIVTYGDRTKPLDAFFREAMIKRYLANRIADPKRIMLIRGEFGPELRTEIWALPAGTNEPKIARAEWSYELSGLTEPLKFGSTGEGGMVECENYDFGLLVKILMANPSMTVKAVFNETSTPKYGAALKKFRDALAEMGIARNRLTASHFRVDSGKYLESIDVWLVPGNTLAVVGDGPKSDQPPTNAPIQKDGSSGTDKSVPRVISGGVVNGKATMLPAPAYPAAARAVRASGAVSVEILIDEQGNVISAAAVSGHPLLRASAVNAAKGAKFTPTLLYGTPVKVRGVLVFNFVP